MNLMRELTSEELSELEKFAYAHLSLQEVAIILDVDETALAQLALNAGNPVYNAYQCGRLRAKSDLNTSIMQAAAAGSTPAQNLAIGLINKHEAEIEKKYAPS
jgi:hypothetical protein